MPTHRSRLVPTVAGVAFLIALMGMAARAYVGGMPQHVSPPRLAERSRLDAASHRDRITAPSVPEVSRGVRPEIAALVQEHEAVRAALAWRVPGAMCH